MSSEANKGFVICSEFMTLTCRPAGFLSLRERREVREILLKLSQNSFDGFARRSVVCVCQSSHSQDRHVICTNPRRGANHLRTTAEMNRQHLQTEAACRFNCSRNSVGNIV